MNRRTVLIASAIATLTGTSGVSVAQTYYDQSPDQQQNYDNGNLQQRGMDALRDFLGTNNGSSNAEVSPDAIVRELERRNFHQISEPVRNGPIYLVYAIDPEANA